LRLSLLGPANVAAGAPPEPVELATQKGAALVFYLAARPEQPVTRTRLIALLWQDSDEQEGRNSLSTALSRVRRSLPSVPIVPAGDSLVWRPDAAEEVWTDIATFQELTRPSATRAQLDTAVDLWRGPFLEGFDLRDCSDWDEWLELERAAWQQRMLDALERAAEAHASESDWSGALAHARRALAIDPLQERFHRLVMRLYERAGDRAAALSHYRVAQQTLAQELGVQPDPRTQRLYRDIVAATGESDAAGPEQAEFGHATDSGRPASGPIGNEVGRSSGAPSRGEGGRSASGPIGTEVGRSSGAPSRGEGGRSASGPIGNEGGRPGSAPSRGESGRSASGPYGAEGGRSGDESSQGGSGRSARGPYGGESGNSGGAAPRGEGGRFAELPAVGVSGRALQGFSLGDAERAMRRQPAFPLVGRQAPLAQLLASADEAAAGRGKLVAIDGEEGIGKSRLVEELLWLLDGQSARDLLPARRWTVLVGACHASERGLPYHPFVDLLSEAVAGFSADVALPDIWLAEVARLVPDLVEQRPDLPTPARLDPQQEARRLFEGAARFLAALPTPCLLVIEDLHWADEGSLRMLDYLAHHDVLRSTLLVTTVRSEDVDPQLLGMLRGLERQRLLERLELGPLPVEATVQLLREVVRDDVRQLGQQLHAETEGNPLFAVETIRSLLESGDLQLGEAARSGPTPLPESVQAAIRARLARLDADAHELARAAAVLGGDVDFDHARGVAGQDEERALAALERLLSSHLLRELSGDVGEALYSFSHDKVRQVVYDDLSGARRRVQHRRALDVLAEPAARTPPERLAYHALRAQAWDQAVRWCQLAADAAVAVFAYTSAATLYEQALDALGRLPESTDNRAHGIRLRLRLAQVAFYVAPGRLGEWLEPAEPAAHALGDATLLAYVHLAQAGALYIQGRFAETLPLLESIRPIAEATADVALRAQYLRVYGQLQALRGDYAAAVPALHEAIDLLRDQPGIELTVATEMLGATYAYMGDFDRALQLIDSAHARSESVQDQAALAAGESFLCAVYHMRGDWALARAHGLRAVNTARAAGSIVHEYVGLVYVGLPEARLGETEAGAASLRRAIAMAQAAGTWVLLGRAHGWLAEIELDRSDVQTAQSLARAGLELSGRYGYLYDAALCERALGKTLLAIGDADAGRAHLQAAAQQFAAIQAGPELTRTRQALAELTQA
jgi:DNA-binding SARP family transcriptional activator